MYRQGSFEQENIPGMLGVEELWSGTENAILNDAFDEEILSEKTEMNGSTLREVYVTSRVINGEPVRVYAWLGLPATNKSGAGVMHIHGGGQTASQDWVKYWTSLGYIAVSFDYAGKADGRSHYTRYPDALAYCNQATCNDYTCHPDARNNCWYEWTYISRRILTYLCAQEGVDVKKIGIFGISMGGTLTWKVAGVDKRVSAAAPIYGVGYDYTYNQYHPYDSALKPSFTDDAKKYIAAVSSEAYAPYITCPILFLSASNDFHGDFDWAGFTYEDLPNDTIHYMSISPNFNHHIFYEQADMLRLFMGAILKQDNTFPKNPLLSIESGQNGKPILNLKVDTDKPITYIKLYYGLEEISAYRRYWDEVEPIVVGEGLYTAAVDVMHLNKPLFAYASVKYEGGYYLSTPVKCVLPVDIGCTVAGAQERKVIYKARENLIGWGASSIGTDPIPSQLYAPILTAAKEGGVTVARSTVIPWTHRLYDPRFFAPSDKSRLKITFRGFPANVTVSIQDVFRVDATPYSCSKQLQKDDMSLTVGLQDLVSEEGTIRTSWSQSPQLQFSGLATGCYIDSIEWIS